MAEIQLDLFPMSYYNTLGFDRELIDYIDLVDDTFLYDIIEPLYKKGGRNYHNPVTMFRTHYLYFAKSKITSYRHTGRILKQSQNQHYRNFISVGGSQRIPSHNSMSDFRTKVELSVFIKSFFTLLLRH